MVSWRPTPTTTTELRAPSSDDDAALRRLEENPPDAASIPALRVNRRGAVAYRDDGTLKRSKIAAVNALLIPYLLSAIRMLEPGTAGAEDIDNGMMHGCAHPHGPLCLADLIGLDTTTAVAESMYAKFKKNPFTHYYYAWSRPASTAADS